MSDIVNELEDGCKPLCIDDDCMCMRAAKIIKQLREANAVLSSQIVRLSFNEKLHDGYR